MSAASLASAAIRKAAESGRVQQDFFASTAEALALCAAQIAARLSAGGHLFTMGNGGSACDAQHLAVEFMHPVVEKRPAWPARALNADSVLMSAVANDQDFSLLFADQLRRLARPADIAIGFSTSGDAANVGRALALGREMGLLTVAIAGRDGGRLAGIAEHVLVVPSYNIHRIQEVHGLITHVLWDLVHLSLGAADVL